MNEIKQESNWTSVKRVRLLAQPIGVGIPMSCAGGYLCWNMILALEPTEPLWLQLSTVGLIALFGWMFVLGVCYLLAPLETIWVTQGEVQLRLGKLVLRRIPENKIHSVGANTREILVRNKEVDLYRMKLRCEKTFPRSLWMDWTVDTEEALRENLLHTPFLL